jgi:hypothetical protein
VTVAVPDVRRAAISIDASIEMSAVFDTVAGPAAAGPGESPAAADSASPAAARIAFFLGDRTPPRPPKDRVG